jgi:predicted tellurium resistance membrane protein TerC
MPFIDLFAPEHVASYLTLTFLEIVLAGDNLVLIAILAGKLPERQRPLARRIGLIAAVITRLMLLFSLFWIAHLEAPIAIPLPDGSSLALTPRQIVLGLGGAFLIWKSLVEISAIFSEHETKIDPGRVRPWQDSFFWIIVQIAIFDIVFSLDSVIAAIGLAQHVQVMVAAVLTATFLMFFLVNPISNFIDRHQVVRLIALNFLTLVGALLVAEAAGLDVPRTYFYLALAVAIVVQILILGSRSPKRGARQPITPVLMLLGAAAVIGATVAANNGSVFGAQILAVVDAIAARGVELIVALVDWVRGFMRAG